MDKVLVYNADRCTGCGLCELTCSLFHTGTCNPERSRIRILRMEQKGVNIQMFCQQCEDGACMAACPVSAINRNESTGTIEIDYELCMKCENCIAECRFKGMSFDHVDDKIIKCDLCGGDPKCVMFCQTRAIEFLEEGPVVLQKKRDSLKELEELLKVTEDF